MIIDKIIEWFVGTTDFQTENGNLRKEVVNMNSTYLKKFISVVALLALLEGCALYVRGNGEYYEHHPHHYHYYGYWR